MTSTTITVKHPKKEGLYIIIDEQDLDLLANSWWMHSNYPGSKEKGTRKNFLIHREVARRKGLDVDDPSMCVDHMDRNVMNASRENLRLIPRSDNNRNRTKAKGASSAYYGVYRSCPTGRKVYWQAKYNKQFASYQDEIHAAYQYNLWVDRANDHCSNKNDVTEPDGFEEKVPKCRAGFSRVRRELQGRIQDDGSYHIPLFNRQRLEVGFTIVDEDTFHKLREGGYTLNKAGAYVDIARKGYKSTLHRWIMNATSFDVWVDHRNGDTFDNRKKNLKPADNKTNPQNRVKKSGTVSRYIGVFKSLNNWRARITVDGKDIGLGTFPTEEDAARARDQEAVKVHTHAILNFPGDVYEGYIKRIIDYKNEAKIAAGDPITGHYRGVYKSGTKWRARVKNDGKYVHLGMFFTADTAARAYDEEVVRLGINAKLNFPEDVKERSKDLESNGTVAAWAPKICEEVEKEEVEAAAT